MKNTKIKVKFDKLTQIFHISDIHIRNLKRHNEYEAVFSRLYSKISSLNDGSSIIYVGGDIVHAKTQMSPELIHLTSDFFKRLADISPTLVLMGNHDCNLNNRSRMDALSPIIENLNHKNLHYMRDSGTFDVADTTFTTWSVLDSSDDYISASDVVGKTKILLFHGTIDHSKTDMGFELPSDVKLSMMDGYDMVLLGDIHKAQTLQRYSTKSKIKKPIVRFCGDLIQQNHGESLKGHGMSVWDVEDRSYKHVEIPNDYGYYTMDIEDGVVPDVDDVPDKARMRIRVSNTTESDLKKALAIIHKRHGIKDVVVNRNGKLIDRVRGSSLEIGDVSDPNYQYELIDDYLKRNHVLDDSILSKIKNINEAMNSDLPDGDVSRNVNWKLKKFEFSNMFSYGDNNTVDFTHMMGIMGLFAQNAAGKSSLLDALSFCLYDTSSRAFKASNVLNNKKNNFECKVNFESAGVDYYIERKGKKLSNGSVKVNVNFYMCDESGDVISLNGDQRRTTNINIKKIIGTFEDFILTSMSLQNNNTVFIDKTQKERKEILAQFMGIGVFDDLYNRAIDEISDVSAVLKNFKQNDYGIELANVESELASKESHHTELKSQYLTLKEKRVIIDEKILDLNKRLKPIDDSILDLDDLESQKTILVDGLESIDTQLGVISSTRNENIINEDELNIRINQHVSDNVNNLFLEYKQHELDRAETKIDIDKLKINVRNKLDKIEKLGNLEYDDNCDYCMNNPFTLDAIDTKSQLDHDKALASEYVVKIDNLDSILESMKWVHQAKIDFDTSIESIKNIEISKNKLDSESTLCIEMKKNIIHQISLIESKILDHNEKQSDIEYNVNIERNLVALELEVVDLNESIVSVDLNINDVYGDVKVLDSKKISILETIDKVTDLEDRYAAYEYYLDAIKRDGVPYELITKALPAIEGAVNDILAQIVDFSIILEMDGKNINTYIVYDDDNVWPLELSSGMERFVSSLAIRVGLINVSNLPRSNFLAIDEGFGNMDADNLNSVYQLFQYLKSQFQFTMVVSHIESMRDAVDSLIEIKKENDFSNVNYI